MAEAELIYLFKFASSDRIKDFFTSKRVAKNHDSVQPMFGLLVLDHDSALVE